MIVSVLVFVSNTLIQAQEPITVSGKVLDDETGKPITAMMIQSGKIDAKDPKKITWGYTHRNTRSKTGRFSTSIRWSQGWTARIVADGYIPQPVLKREPKLGEAKIEVEIRLKKGQPVSGQIVDHLGKPVKDAKVYAVSARGLNFFDGEARERYGTGKIDDRAKYVKTDASGKFKIHPGGMGTIVVCAPTIDAFAHKCDLASTETARIQLPKPTKVKITYDIPMADEEMEIFYQFLSHLSEGYQKIESTRSFPAQKRKFHRVEFTASR